MVAAFDFRQLPEKKRRSLLSFLAFQMTKSFSAFGIATVEPLPSHLHSAPRRFVLMWQGFCLPRQTRRDFGDRTSVPCREKCLASRGKPSSCTSATILCIWRVRTALRRSKHHQKNTCRSPLRQSLVGERRRRPTIARLTWFTEEPSNARPVPSSSSATLHMGDGGARDNFPLGDREKQLNLFLDYVGSQQGELIILGDLFDFWQMNLSKIVMKHMPLLDRLAAMNATYVVGNHDADFDAFHWHGFLIPSAISTNVRAIREGDRRQAVQVHARA